MADKEDSKFKEGNKAAEKWNEDKVIGILEDMIEFASEEKKTIIEVGNKPRVWVERVHLKKELLLEFNIYKKNWFNYIANKFKDNESVSGLLNAIEMICEVNSYKQAANGQSNSNIVKMNLATHYGWADKSESTHSGEVFNKLRIVEDDGEDSTTNDTDE